MDEEAAERPPSLVEFAGKLLGRAVVCALFPVLFAQAFALWRHALRLVPAAGPLIGRIGRGEPLQFLAIGDSIIGGVGARRVERRTVVHVARFMSGRLSREVNWNATGIIGVGARRVLGSEDSTRWPARRARVPNVTHIPVRFSLRPGMFSDDGLHPSETSQRRLGTIIAEALTPRLAGSAADVARPVPARFPHAFDYGPPA